MDSPTPIVSIIIPNYNHERYLDQRIDSVLQQTYVDSEILILDDCSTDNSRKIIERYATRDNRIRVLYNEKNSGSTFCQWNKGITAAKGKYLWLAESDDYAHPEMLAALVASLENNSQVGMAYCDSMGIDENGNYLHEWKEILCADLKTDLWKSSFILPGLNFMRRFMSYYNVIPNASATLLRRSVVQQVGLADENTRLAGDWLYWIAILSKGDIAYIHNTYNFFRSHINNVRAQTTTNGILLEETSRVLLKVRETLGDTEENELAAQKLLDRWFMAFIYDKIPVSRNLALTKNMNNLLGSSVLLKKWAHFIFNDNLRGARLLLGDGLLYKFIANK
jgi:glycosyltransferase involved in cell wall biosynthesis